MVALELIDAQVRDAVRRRGIDPASEPAAVRGLVEEIVRAYDERSLTGAVPVLEDVAGTTQHVYDAVAGYGLLQRYFDDPKVEESGSSRRTCIRASSRAVSRLTGSRLSAVLRTVVEQFSVSAGRWRRRRGLSCFIGSSLP